MITASVVVEAIPAELREQPRWLRWKAVPNEKGKIDKVPWHATRNAPGSSTNPATWATFSEAMASAGMHGTVGLGFALGDGFVGADFDDCLTEAGKPDRQTESWIKSLNTYTEISPSGLGLHAIGRGTLNRHRGLNRKKEMGIEVYESGRYFTVTGRVFPGAPATVNDCQPALDALIAELLPKKPATPSPPQAVKGDDYARIFERARRYVDVIPAAVSGQGGHDQTFAVAVALCYGWDLEEADAWEVLNTFSARCEPPWSERSCGTS